MKRDDSDILAIIRIALVLLVAWALIVAFVAFGSDAVYLRV